MAVTIEHKISLELVLPYLKDQPLKFANVESLRIWVSQQLNAFESIASAANMYEDLWSRHTGAFRGIEAAIDGIPDDGIYQQTASQRDHQDPMPGKFKEVRQILNLIETGELITTLHPNFQIAEFLSNRGDHLQARTVLLLSTKDGLEKRGTNEAFRDIESLFRALMSLHSLAPLSERPVERWTKDFADLHQKTAENMAAFGSLFTQAKRDQKAHISDHEVLRMSQAEGWDAHMKDTREQWDLMRSVYDEQLALAAPATYWTERNVSHTKAAKMYASVFVAAVAVSISMFIWKGIPYLSGITVGDGQSALVSVLPVVIPLFGVVWMLRILARQLSENMTLMQDAKERVTMVKTFLALMKDETTGKSVVTDQDRVLILHSLFRPSTITATDDSPPLSILERLNTKSK